MSRSNHRTDLDARRLDRDWDSAVGGLPVGLPSSVSNTITNFLADGAALEPSTAFVRRLEEELMDVHYMTPRWEPKLRVIAPDPAVPTHSIPSVSRSSWSRWPIVDVAVIVLFALGIAAFIAAQSGSISLPWQTDEAEQSLQQISGGPVIKNLPATAATPMATPVPVNCTVPARTIEEVISIVGIAGPKQWDDLYSRSIPTTQPPDIRPSGVPAPADVVAEIQYSLDQFIACTPYRTRLASMWFSSQEAIERDFNNPLTSDIIAALQDPAAAPQSQFGITSAEIERAEVLNDGRVMVDFVITVAPVSGGELPEPEHTAIFVYEDGLWRLDEDLVTNPPDTSLPAMADSGFVQRTAVSHGTPP